MSRPETLVTSSGRTSLESVERPVASVPKRSHASSGRRFYDAFVQPSHGAVRRRGFTLAADYVALAATIGGSVVAVAGVGATVWSGWQQRKSANELADREHAHERDLARGARLFQRRAEVYEELLGFLMTVNERVNATVPVMTFSGQPEPPEMPSREKWLAMEARVRTVRSAALADAYEEWRAAVNDFGPRAIAVHEMEIENVPNRGDARMELEAARERVTVARSAIELLVSEELATL